MEQSGDFLQQFDIRPSDQPIEFKRMRDTKKVWPEIGDTVVLHWRGLEVAARVDSIERHIDRLSGKVLGLSDPKVASPDPENASAEYAGLRVGDHLTWAIFHVFAVED